MDEFHLRRVLNDERSLVNYHRRGGGDNLFRTSSYEQSILTSCSGRNNFSFITFKPLVVFQGPSTSSQSDLAIKWCAFVPLLLSCFGDCRDATVQSSHVRLHTYSHTWSASSFGFGVVDHNVSGQLVPLLAGGWPWLPSYIASVRSTAKRPHVFTGVLNRWLLTKSLFAALFQRAPEFNGVLVGIDLDTSQPFLWHRAHIKALDSTRRASRADNSQHTG